MPFINSKVSVKTTEEQQKELKTRLGQAISIIPGKSESWLMVNLEDDRKMYFRGDDSEPIAFVCMNIYDFKQSTTSIGAAAPHGRG